MGHDPHVGVTTHQSRNPVFRLPPRIDFLKNHFVVGHDPTLGSRPPRWGHAPPVGEPCVPITPRIDFLKNHVVVGHDPHIGVTTHQSGNPVLRLPPDRFFKSFLFVRSTGKAENLRFEWLLTPWSKCSQTCGGSGFQVDRFFSPGNQ